MFFVVRVVLGIGESVAYPAYSKIIARLYVEHQRGIANALISAGLAMGPGVGLLVGGPLMAKYGWRPFFLVLGSAALLWLIPWVWWMPSLPGEPSHSPGPGFAEIIRHRPLWATSLCLFCANYGLYFTVTWLPFYLVRERGFTMRQMAWVGAAYFFALALSTAICGKLADRLIEAGHTPSRVRKACMIIALSFTGVFFALSVFLPRPLGVVCLLLAGIATGPGASNVFAIAQRLAGLQAVGRWTGIQLFCGNMSGVVVSAVTGYLVQHSGHFTSAFLVVTAVLWVGAITWGFGVGPIEPVPWSQAELIETFEPTVHAS